MDKSKLMLTLIIVLLLLLLGTIVGAVMYIGTSLKNTQAAAPPKPSANLSVDQIDLYPLSSAINTNLLAEKPGDNNAIRISITIGIDNTDKKNSPDVLTLVQNKEAIVRDAALTILRGKTASYMKSDDGQQGFSKDLLDKLQTLFQTNLIVAVYISDIYVQ